MFEKLKHHLERWERGERLDDRALEDLEEEFETWLDTELGDIAHQADAGQGEAALGRLTRLNAFAAAAAAQRPSLANAVGAKAAAFKSALQAIGWSLGAVEFSITLGVPIALSVTLSFRVMPQGEAKPAAAD
jgi:hypothetical protein